MTDVHVGGDRDTSSGGAFAVEPYGNGRRRHVRGRNRRRGQGLGRRALRAEGVRHGRFRQVYGLMKGKGLVKLDVMLEKATNCWRGLVGSFRSFAT